MASNYSIPLYAKNMKTLKAFENFKCNLFTKFCIKAYNNIVLFTNNSLLNLKQNNLFIGFY